MTLAERVSQLKGDFDALHEKCVSRHYVSSFVGDGTETATFDMPFEPDLIAVCCFESANLTTVGSLGMFIHDSVQRGALGGYATISAGNGYTLLTLGRSNISNKYSYIDGKVTVRGISSSLGTALFGEGQTYIVTAVKYAEDNPTAVAGTFALRRPSAEAFEDAESAGEWDGEVSMI